MKTYRTGYPYDAKTIARFWSKVDTNGPDHPYNPKLGKCWIWTGAVLPNGYAVFYTKRAKGETERYAHRFSFINSHGVIKQGMDICHSCDVRHCVNPLHLWQGTRKQNIRDCMSKGRKPSMPTGGRFKSGIDQRRKLFASGYDPRRDSRWRTTHVK